MAAQKLVAVDFEVFGRVQGVFFRKEGLAAEDWEPKLTN